MEKDRRGKRKNPWHRILGIALTDLFYQTPYEVEMEKDVSQKRQLLDILILQKSAHATSGVGEGLPLQLPDGLDVLRQYNLISYKSMHESFTGWVLPKLSDCVWMR